MKKKLFSKVSEKIVVKKSLAVKAAAKNAGSAKIDADETQGPLWYPRKADVR